MTEEDNELIGQANIIWEIKMAFHPSEFTDKPAEYDKRIRHDYRLAHQEEAQMPVAEEKEDGRRLVPCLLRLHRMDWLPL